jgi:hypothetical protein
MCAGHNVAFRPTHSLEESLSQCEAIDASFGLSLAARTLTPYAVRFRYPGGPLAPTSVEAEEVLHLADVVVQFVRVRLLARVRGSSETLQGNATISYHVVHHDPIGRICAARPQEDNDRESATNRPICAASYRFHSHGR